MTEPKTSRPFRERFLDGFDRSQLRQEVRRVKRKGFLNSVRKRSAAWGLGAAMALGGIGVPLKVSNVLRHAAQPRQESASAGQRALPEPDPSATPEQQQAGIASDLQTAQQIAKQVTAGAASAVTDVAHTAESAPQVAAQAPQAVANVAEQAAGAAAEQAKEAFFAREVPFGSIIYQEAKKNDLPPELVAAVAHTESKFIPTARSNRGAVGLMQLEPRTGRWLGASNLMNPVQNIQAGAKYLRYLADRFGGDVTKAVAAYNAGEGSVRRFGGVPPFRETRNYVQRVQSFQQDLGTQLQGQSAELNAP